VAVLGQEKFRLGQLGPVAGPLQVQDKRICILGGERPGQCRFADLPRTKQHNAGVKGQAFSQVRQQESINHPCILIGRRSICKDKI